MSGSHAEQGSVGSHSALVRGGAVAAHPLRSSRATVSRRPVLAYAHRWPATGGRSPLPGHRPATLAASRSPPSTAPGLACAPWPCRGCHGAVYVWGLTSKRGLAGYCRAVQLPPPWIRRFLRRQLLAADALSALMLAGTLGAGVHASRGRTAVAGRLRAGRRLPRSRQWPARRRLRAAGRGRVDRHRAGLASDP